nr:hypothetical protein [Tanacetum cinerariifolium]
QGEDSDLKDSIDQTDLANRDDLFVDPTLEMFTDEQPPDYSLPLRFDVYPDNFLEIESDADNFYDDSFDSKGEKIKDEDCLEVSVSHKQSGNPTFSLHKEITSPEVTHEIHDSAGCNFLSEEWPDIDSFNDIHPRFNDNPLSGSTTYSSNSLLEEFTDKLALITY